jgi:hypothetical protein
MGERLENMGLSDDLIIDPYIYRIRERERKDNFNKKLKIGFSVGIVTLIAGGYYHLANNFELFAQINYDIVSYFKNLIN